MPWRESDQPYHVLVSEFMLQQTRVETVIPYYERWLARFPDVESLARAQEYEVLKQWEGLGYYARARNLQRTAQMVREKYNGALPSTYAELKQLPGVGPYTAAAVASISFAQPHAAVDGNVKRVLSRVFDRPAPSQAELQSLADQLLDNTRPGDFNQAMMELGATVCTPRQPACKTCPLVRLCRAYHNSTVELRPAPKQKRELPHEKVNTLVAVDNGEVLVAQRASNGLLAGLWEFPEVADTRGFQPLGTVTHTFTHKRITYQVHASASRARVRARTRVKRLWLPVERLDELAMPTAQRRIAKLALPFFGL